MKVDIKATSDKVKDFAEFLYKSYTANSDNLNFQGNPCPAWKELPEQIQSHWCAVAKAANPDLS